MTLTIKLTPTQEAKLEAVARETDTEPQEFAKRLVEDDLSLTAMPSANEAGEKERFVSDGFRRTLNAIPEGRRPEFIQELLVSAQSGSYNQLLDTITRWAEIGSSQDTHPFSQYAGAFAGDAIFAEVKQTIAANRRGNKRK